MSLKKVLTLLGERNLIHAGGYGWQQDLCFIFQADSFDKGGDDFDSDFAVLFNLVVERDNESAGKLFAVVQVQNVQ
jgi:hypothetical protein